jgi:hypothetical protein
MGAVSWVSGGIATEFMIFAGLLEDQVIVEIKTLPLAQL